MAAKKKTTPRKRPVKPDLDWFVHDRFGLFIHWGLYALPARHEWMKASEKLSHEQYQVYFDHFNPDLYDPHAWARAARDAGMKYFVVTTKHHEGFCLWDSKHTDFKSTMTPCGKDLLKPMVEAFRDEGMKIGFYHSLIDWHHHEFPIDINHPQWHDEECKAREKNRDVRKYADYLHAQTRELLTQFGKIDVMWFDYSYPRENGKGREDWQSEKLIKMVRELQPGIIVNNRLDLPGKPDVLTPEQYVPNEVMCHEDGSPAAWEGCQTFSGSWGYHRDENSWKSVPMLIEMLVDHVSKGGNLLLNVGPTGRGEFDYRALDRLKGIGDWMKRHDRAIYGCTFAPDGIEAPKDCRYTYDPKTKVLYLHLFSWPFKHVHLPGLAGKIKYAQLLNDASEIKFRSEGDDVHAALNAATPTGALTLELPVPKPPAEVPVIELFPA